MVTRTMDPVTLEVIKNALNSLADEMALIVMRSAYSGVIKDALDYMAVWQTGMFARDHMKEVFLAQQQKRQPRFPDLAAVRKKL